MTPDDAARLLQDRELVVLLTGALAYAKEVRDSCLEAGVAAMLGECTGKTWGTKANLLVQEVDVPRALAVMNAQWRDLVAREHGGAVMAPTDAVAEDGYPPCPACGCTRAPENGECTDCGLFLG